VAPTSGKAVTMSSESEAVEAAVRDLVHAMSQLVRAIDAVGSDDTAVASISEDVPAKLEELAGRLSAAQSLKG
jgi:hypothetical protein